MEIVYRATDGKEFADQQECEDYERESLLKFYTPNILGFASKYGSCPLDYADENFIEDAFVVIIKTPEAMKEFQRRCTDESVSIRGLTNPPGVYIWDDESGEAGWINVEIRRKEMIRELAYFDSIYKIYENAQSRP